MDLQDRLEKIFPTPDKDEKVIFFQRKHWFLFFVIFIILFFMLIVPFVFIAISARTYPQFFSGSVINFLVIFSSAYLLFLCAAFLLSFINLYFDIVILTNKRIVDINQKGLFNRQIDELDLLHIEDVSSHVSGFFGTTLDFGEVEVQTAGTARNFLLNGMPHPRQLCRQILEQYEKALKTQEGGERMRKIDLAEGSPRRLQTFSPQDIAQPSKNEGRLEEGKMIDLSPPANDKVLLKFNIEKNKLDEVLKILPSLKSPTINDLADSQYAAVETVVQKSQISNLIPELKKRGGTDIIESDIKTL